MNDSGTRRIRRTKLALGAVSLATVLLAACAPAPDARPTDTEAALAAVTEADGSAGAAVLTPEGLSADSAVGSVDLDGDSMVVQHPDGTTATIEMPATGDHSVTQDGIVSDGPGDADVVTRTTDEGDAQALIVVNGPADPTRYDFPVTTSGGEAVLQPQEDGSVTVSDGSEVVATIAAPWAVDANGASVPTHYELSGTTLTQVVEHTEATAFPVVADPKVSIGWRVYVTFNRSEVKSAVRAGVGSASGVVRVVCKFIPHAAAKAACSIASATVLKSVGNTFVSAGQQNRCVELGYLYQTLNLVLVSWKPVNC